MLLVLLAGTSQAQKLDVTKSHEFTLPEIAADQMVLMMVSSAYLARVYDDYLPWWQADLLAFSSTALLDLTNHLLNGGGDGFHEVGYSHQRNLKYDVVGVFLNRALPIIFNSSSQLVKTSLRDGLSVSIDPENYPKIQLSLHL